ncbi:hypothetical protein JCM8097_000926 [Rhodosporidiobolus ruineniae]
MAWLPRKAIRALRYLLVASAVLALCYSRACTPPTFASSSPSSSPATTRFSHVDFAWGSILHRFQNHPRPPAKRAVLPWTDQPPNRDEAAAAAAPSRVLIVTSELAGLHKNGGIGTAFTELAQALAGGRDFEVSILVSHLEAVFAEKKRERLREELAAKRISLLFVEEEPQPFWPQAWTPVASMRVWNYLRSRDGSYDIVHFPDNTGIGFFSALGKYEGLALQSSRLVVGLHGADVEWAAMLNKRYPVDKYAIELGIFERRTAELADAVVAPSEYILEYSRSRGWDLPSASFVIPNVVQVPELPAETQAGADIVEPVTELVFFGRLEERKGVRLLVSALESLASSDSPRLPPTLRTVTFVGRDQPDVATRTDVSVLVGQALESIHEHTNATFDYQFLKTLDRDEALSYLQDPRRLAVLPSLADNSPSTVLECIAHGIRFIASTAGGVPELVHADDQHAVLFAPLVRPFADKLVETLARLETKPWLPVRPAPATQTAAADWIAFHHWLAARPTSLLPSSASSFPAEPFVSILVTHYERTHLVDQLLDSLLGQSYTNFEVVLVDDGSSSPASLAALDQLEQRYFSSSSVVSVSNTSHLFNASSLPERKHPWRLYRHPNAYLGEARNRAAAHASPSSQFLLFLDDDDVLKPHALETLVSVARRTGARALSTWLDEFATDVNPLAPRNIALDGPLPHRRTYWFLGQSLSAGLLSNSFGSGNVFVDRKAFEQVGGFSTYREVGGEDWEFWTRLAIEGVKQETVPDELIFVRSDPARASMKFSMDPWDAHFHATVPLLNDGRVQELGLAHSLMLLKGIVTRTHVVPAFADSMQDFQLVQGWGGWHYSFERFDRGGDETLDYWSPKVSEATLGVVDNGNFVMDRNHLRKPYIDDSYQEGWIGQDGQPVFAIRTFRSPKRMDVAIDAQYRATHKCGDGTIVSLISVGGVGEVPHLHVRWNTSDDTFDEYAGDISLRPGSMLHLVSDPGETDECDDRVEVRLKLTPISLDNKSWSALTKKAAIEASEREKEKAKEKKEEMRAGETKPPAQTWAVAEVAQGPDEDDVFNVALIFDRNRYPHAKSVIRSAQHFLTSPRQLVFHLITPRELHSELEDFFANQNMSLRLYDHALCGVAARKILPFSDPDIHTSAHCKVFLPEIITFAERVLYLDTDVTVVSDLARCYAKPSRNPGALVSMAVDMGDACQRNPDACWPIGLHWRVPTGLGLECGNVPGKDDPKRPPQSCADEGELETLQVNGGVMMLELAKMKEAGFINRYVQSVVHHYRAMKSEPARWGEQDFVNSYFRLFPQDLEMLPCGCNYQWFGSRREVKCGEQEVSIAHHWSHGIARRTQDPYNSLFFHFVDNGLDVPPPPAPALSPSLPGAPNTSAIDVVNSFNCPRQGHDCNAPFTGTEYGQPVVVLSRILSETFAADLIDSLEAQSYPKISHAVAFREGVDVPSTSFPQDQVELPADPAEEYAALCEACGDLAAEGQSCSVAPADAASRKRYFDCVCALEDKNGLVMFDLEAAAQQSLVEHDGDGGWILYLDDTHAFVGPGSLSLLMAEVDGPDELVLFRSNSSNPASPAQDYAFGRKILPRSPLGGVGFLFHSSHLDLTDWSASTRCGKWRTLDRLSHRLKVKWLDLVPVVEHPLQRHLPHTPAEDFQLSVVILETQGKISWTPLILELFEEPELMPVFKEVVVASVDTEEGAYGPDVRIVNPTVGSGLAELASLVEGEHVLLLSDSVYLDKTALTALVNFHLDSPSRLVGVFTETDTTGDFSLPLATTEEDFDIFSEPDALVGLPSWTHLLPRALVTSKSNLEELSSVLGASAAEPLHPTCHPVLLSALSTRASSGLSPLRVLPPKQSLVDRVFDCRQRNYPDIAYGRTAGDWAVPALPVDEEDEDEVGEPVEFDEDGNEVVPELEKREKWAEAHLSEDDFPVPPSLDDCLAAVAALLGDGADEWLVHGDEVGVSGPLGGKVGVVKADEISEERWGEARKMEKCYRA